MVAAAALKKAKQKRDEQLAGGGIAICRERCKLGFALSHCNALWQIDRTTTFSVFIDETTTFTFWSSTTFT